MKSIRVKPSKSQSLVGMIGGAVFVFIGFSIVFKFGIFGMFWILIALAIKEFMRIIFLVQKVYLPGKSMLHRIIQLKPAKCKRASMIK